MPSAAVGNTPHNPVASEELDRSPQHRKVLACNSLEKNLASVGLPTGMQQRSIRIVTQASPNRRVHGLYTPDRLKDWWATDTPKQVALATPM